MPCKAQHRPVEAPTQTASGELKPGAQYKTRMKTAKNKIMILKGRFVLAMLMVLCSVQFMSAAGNGLSGINEATNMVSSYFEPGVKLIYAIGAVVGLIGGVKCYSKWSSGDPDTSKTAASWFGACIFLIVAATILKSFFL